MIINVCASKTNEKHICLALQGGGAYGAFTWGVLDKLLEDERLKIDAISATSSGGVNATVLAYGMLTKSHAGARQTLHDFWYSLSQFATMLSPVKQSLPAAFSDYDLIAQVSFHLFDAATRIFSPYQLNPMNYNLLELLLVDKIDFKALREAQGIKLFLSATNVKTGQLKVFETHEITLDVVLASACLPHISQAIKIGDDYYWDGGYLGNPAIFPLIYNSNVDDIVIIHTNPLKRDMVPTDASEIADRVNEISFNSSLLRELRVIAFITEMIDNGWIKKEFKDKLRRKSIHFIRSDEVMKKFGLADKYNWHWDFISELRDMGRLTAEHWLHTHFDNLGTHATINFEEFY